MENKKLFCKNCGKEIIPCDLLGRGIRHGQQKCRGYVHLEGYYHSCGDSPIAEIDSDSTPAKPESPSKPDTDITSVNAKTPLFEASQESASPDGKSSTESTQQTETGGGFTIIHMDKITDKKD